MRVRILVIVCLIPGSVTVEGRFSGNMVACESPGTHSFSGCGVEPLHCLHGERHVHVGQLSTAAVSSLLPSSIGVTFITLQSWRDTLLYPCIFNEFFKTADAYGEWWGFRLDWWSGALMLALLLMPLKGLRSASSLDGSGRMHLCSGAAPLCWLSIDLGTEYICNGTKAMGFCAFLWWF